MPPQPLAAAGSVRGGNSASVDCLTILGFSHLRWDFVFQRPQHLMSRFARSHRVCFWEEPVYVEGLDYPALAERCCPETGVIILVPQLPAGRDAGSEQGMLRAMLDEHVARCPGPLLTWYYTPMMLPFSQHLAAACIVYDCMDELANFKGAPPELLTLEKDLLRHADLVFTGGHSLYEAKRDRHPDIHPFPSSVDVGHFGQAREAGDEPADQQALGRPRLGFFGVVDERMDLALLASLADARPDYQIVILGPVVKISPDDLPGRPNLHYLGSKPYQALPDYVRGWDVALMPFAINEATRFISPTKTPEYLAAGCPVVSTPITDVIRHYADLDGVRIGATPEDFVQACDEALILSRASSAWLDEADERLAQNSWDSTFLAMWALIEPRLGRAVHPIVTPAGGAARSAPYDVMVVGAGFAGAVMAERLASQSGKRVLVVDRRPHIAGNAYDRFDDAGILIHQYGPHIFHTNSADIVDYLSRFTDWRPYEHRVLAEVDRQLLPIPINRTTLNCLYGLDLDSDEAAADFLASRAEPVSAIRTSEDVVVAAIGRDLYEKFFRGYTRKQWGVDPSGLDRSVTARVPTRTNCDDRYFNDIFQAMPAQGYTRMFERMLDHPNIDVLLGTDHVEARGAYPHAHLVFTGAIDEYFGYCFGRLPYRSLRFQHQTVARTQFQPVAVVNYPDETVPYTRVTEYKHLTGQQAPVTSISYEYPAAVGDPYYPVPNAENQALFKRYEALAANQSNVTFVGRLATYRYYNMDQVVGQALATWRRKFAEPTAATALSLAHDAAQLGASVRAA